MKINGIGSSATQSYISLGSHSEHADIALVNQPFTVFAIVANNSGPGPIMGHNDNNTINAGWLFDLSSGSGMRLRAEHASANFTVSVAIPLGSLYNSPMAALCFSCDGSHTATAGTAAAYYNGVPLSAPLSYTAGSGITGSDAAQTLYIGGNQPGMSGSASLTSAVEMLAVWRRQLTPGEVQSLSRDRLQLFRRRSQLRTIGVLPASSTTRSRRLVIAVF